LVYPQFYGVTIAQAARLIGRSYWHISDRYAAVCDPVDRRDSDRGRVTFFPALSLGQSLNNCYSTPGERSKGDRKMETRSTARPLFDGPIVRRAAIDAICKLDPESHPHWMQFYANALRDAIRKANSRRRDTLTALTTADWLTRLLNQNE
jgi:hypothetical protein